MHCLVNTVERQVAADTVGQQSQVHFRHLMATDTFLQIIQLKSVGSAGLNKSETESRHCKRNLYIETKTALLCTLAQAGSCSSLVVVTALLRLYFIS